MKRSNGRRSARSCSHLFFFFHRLHAFAGIKKQLKRQFQEDSPRKNESWSIVLTQIFVFVVSFVFDTFIKGLFYDICILGFSLLNRSTIDPNMIRG
jgi:hypothetical protein